MSLTAVYRRSGYAVIGILLWRVCFGRGEVTSPYSAKHILKQPLNARATKLRPINGTFRGLFGMSLICLITTAPCCLKAGFIRRSQIAWGFIPRRRDETAPPFFQGTRETNSYERSGDHHR